MRISHLREAIQVLPDDAREITIQGRFSTELSFTSREIDLEKDNRVRRAAKLTSALDGDKRYVINLANELDKEVMK